MGRRFICEALRPVTQTADAARMAVGEPGLPRLFAWRGETLEVAQVLRVWKDTGPCRHGSNEAYVRRHWFQVHTTRRQLATLYFERQPRSRRDAPRWWLYTLQDFESP